MTESVLTCSTADKVLTDLRGYLDDEPVPLSLPPAAFCSEDLWELERKKIFRSSWVLVGHAESFRQTGDYLALSIAGESVVVVRAETGELHALSPVCRHRLMPVVEPGAGRTDTFTCPYHLWSYRLDGQLRGAPFMRDNPNFDAKSCRLPQFSVAEWNGLVWVNLDANAEPVVNHLDLAAEDFANYRLGELVSVSTWTEQWHVNWKLAMENAQENYHVMGLHADTLESLTPGRVDLFVHEYSPLLTQVRIPFAAPVEPVSLSLNAIQKANAIVLVAFPTTLIFGIGDMVSWFSFIPLGVDRIEVRGGALTTPELAAEAGAGATAEQLIAAINDEDRIGVEAVQRVTNSWFAERGHLSVKEQPSLMVFYRKLAAALLGEAAAGQAGGFSQGCRR